MNMINRLRQRIKARDTIATRVIYATAKAVLNANLPPVRVVHQPLHMLISGVARIVTGFVRATYWKPVFLCRIANSPKRMVYFGNGIPYMSGPLHMEFGDDCRISSGIAIIGRTASPKTPRLIVGDNVGIGWQQGIYVGQDIIIGNNVRIAGQGSLSGYPGHPLDAAARARGEPDHNSQAKSIVLEDDVWLGRGVVVNGGVTIGRGTVVATGSVVTKNFPAGVLAGGAPCRVIRKLEVSDGSEPLKVIEKAA